MGRSGKRSLAALAVAAAALAAAHQSRCYCDAFMAPCSWSAAVPEKARLPATPSSSIRLIRLLPWLLNREGGRRIARRRGHATSQTSATSTARMTAETTSDSGSNEGLDVENIVIIGSGPAVRLAEEGGTVHGKRSPYSMRPWLDVLLRARYNLVTATAPSPNIPASGVHEMRRGCGTNL